MTCLDCWAFLSAPIRQPPPTSTEAALELLRPAPAAECDPLLDTCYSSRRVVEGGVEGGAGSSPSGERPDVPPKGAAPHAVGCHRADSRELLETIAEVSRWRTQQRSPRARRGRSAAKIGHGQTGSRCGAERLQGLIQELQLQGRAKAGRARALLGSSMKSAASSAWTATTCSQALANLDKLKLTKDKLDCTSFRDDSSTCSGGSSSTASIWGSSSSGSSSGVGIDDVVPAIVDGTLVRQPEDGSCLFHSLAHGLGDKTSSAELRWQITEFMQERPLMRIASTTIEDWMRITTGKSPGDYTRELAQSRTWGGALEMAVAARIKSVNIHVYERCGDRYRCITTFTEPSASKTVSVVYRTTPSRHYDALTVRPAAQK